MLAEFLAFADTGMAGFHLEKRSDGVEVTSQHGLYNNGEDIGETADLPMKEESFGTRSLFIIGCHILQALQSGSPFFIDEMDSGHTGIGKGQELGKHHFVLWTGIQPPDHFLVRF